MASDQWRSSEIIVSNGVCLIALVRQDMYDNCFLYYGICTMAIKRWQVSDRVFLMASVQWHASDGVRPMASAE